MNASNPSQIGLYLHIPFCRQLCHYCDFVKTANWNTSIKKAYFEKIAQDIKAWITFFYKPNQLKINSIFIGGGTPGLFTVEYEYIFKLLYPVLEENVEITIEVHPENISKETLQRWKSIGINRLSVGVQSFLKESLSFLNRSQDINKTKKALSLGRSYFSNLSVDLIYGWKGQTLADWSYDLGQAKQIDPAHISLYNLTYASKTPLGRAFQRGKLKALNDDTLFEYYNYAKEYLSALSYEHNEVSNWSKINHSCQHNWAYWQSLYYVGVGVGAHGFIPHSDSEIGLRYAYPQNERQWIRSQKLVEAHFSDPLPKNLGYFCHVESRNKEDWLVEYVGSGLRTCRGIDLKKIKAISRKIFYPKGIVIDALEKELLSLKGDCLVLTPLEWFRETSWCFYVLDCFVGV